MGVNRDTPASTAPDSAAARPAGPGASFGRYLQDVRIQKQIRLSQVADETRIRVAILEAIEREDIDQLPPDVFTVGFLKAYAQAIGADGREAVQRYHALRRLRRPIPEAEPPPDSGRRGVPHKLLAALAMLAVLIAACLWGYRQWQSVPDETIPDASPLAEAPTPAPPETPAAQPPSEAARNPATAPGPKHLLTITAHENSWVKVVIDQGSASEHKLKAGDRLRLEAHTGFNLLIGNVGGVKLNLDNQPVTIPGKRGEVVNIHLP
jgi:cytoskeletal protein RodZ